MTFTKINLSGERVLVKGTDQFGTSGETVLDASEWNEVTRRTGHNAATADFDKAVEKFFAPLTEAAEKLDLAFNQQTRDPISFVVLEEGTEATPARNEVVIKLSSDSVVLRLLEEGGDDRLIWVDKRLEVLEVLPGTSGVAPAQSSPEPHELADTNAEG